MLSHRVTQIQYPNEKPDELAAAGTSTTLVALCKHPVKAWQVLQLQLDVGQLLCTELLNITNLVVRHTPSRHLHSNPLANLTKVSYLQPKHGRFSH